MRKSANLPIPKSLLLMMIVVGLSGCQWERRSVSEDPGAARGAPAEGPVTGQLTESNIGRPTKSEDRAPVDPDQEAVGDPHRARD
jgi:hypothetical protein